MELFSKIYIGDVQLVLHSQTAIFALSIINFCISGFAQESSLAT